jgi:hypothetical protein
LPSVPTPKEWSTVSVTAPEPEPPLLDELELEELELAPLDEPELLEEELLEPPEEDEELPEELDDDEPLDPLEELLEEPDDEEPLELLEEEEPPGLLEESSPPHPDINRIMPTTMIETSKRRMITPNSSTTKPGPRSLAFSPSILVRVIAKTSRREAATALDGPGV